MTDDDIYRRLLGKALSFVSLRPRSRKEIILFLQKRSKQTGKREEREDLCQRVVERLEELRYIDDVSFVRTYIERTEKSHPLGVRMIREKMRLKGAQTEAVEAVLTERDEAYERDVAKRAVAKKIAIWKKLPIEKQKQRMYTFLTRKGFSSGITYGLIDELLRKDYNT